MHCFGCGAKLDPILTFQRPHGRYARCEGCRARIRQATHQVNREKAEQMAAEGLDLAPYWKRFLGHVCGRVC